MWVLILADEVGLDQRIVEVNRHRELKGGKFQPHLQAKGGIVIDAKIIIDKRIRSSADTQSQDYPDGKVEQHQLSAQAIKQWFHSGGNQIPLRFRSDSPWNPDEFSGGGRKYKHPPFRVEHCFHTTRHNRGSPGVKAPVRGGA